MMGFGTMGSGAGGYSSSTSNLSALAPPFTVDRLNPKPSTNPLLNYSDSPYVSEPYTRPWQYARPSAPSPELVINSTGVNSVPVYDDYPFSASASFCPSSTQWSATNSSTKAMGSAFGYGNEVEPYYSHYDPPLAGEGSLIVADEAACYNVVPTSGLSGTSQHDYTQSLVDLEYGPRWVDSLGFDNGKQAEISELNGAFSSEKANVGGSHSYINQVYQGWHGSENKNQSKEDSVFSYQSLNEVSDREGRTGSPTSEHMKDKSCLEQNFGFIPNNSNATLVTASSSSYPEFYPPVLSGEMQKNSTNYRNSYNPYDKSVRPIDTAFHGRASVIRASPAVVIRPPPAMNGNLVQTITSRKPACSMSIGTGTSTKYVDFDCTNPWKLKDSGLQPSSKTKEESFGTNLFNFATQGNGLISSTSVAPNLFNFATQGNGLISSTSVVPSLFNLATQGNGHISSTSVKELSSTQHSMGNSDRNVKARFGSRLTDINVSGGFTVAGDKDSLENIDHHNTAVDSPCWKGAPSSQLSTFDVEAGNSNHAELNLDERYGFRLEEHKDLPTMVDRVFSEKVEGNMEKENECARNGIALALERTLGTLFSTKEQSLSDVGAKDTVWASPVRSKGVEPGGGQNMLHKESNLPNNLRVFDVKVSDLKHSFGEEGAGMTVNDVSEGAAVAVDAAEKVLASPDSQDNATEHAVVPDPKLNVSAMIKAIHNLSELLWCHISSDACSLVEENTETLKHVISNLDACLDKKVVLPTSKPEPNNIPVGDSVLGESRNGGTISGSSYVKSDGATPHIKFDHLHMQERERNYSFPGKTDENSPIFSPLRDELDISRNDDMTKAMKKVLEENFQLNEEMNSQALLFKSLWLEAEAKICSISYKARFDRMKIQMEQNKCKALRGNEDIAEIMPQVLISPDSVTTSELAYNHLVGTSPDPTLKNISNCENAGDVEPSVLARFNILKSREDNIKPMNMEGERMPEVVGGADANADSITGQFNLHKSHVENSKAFVMDKEKQPKMIGGDADSAIARFNVLKSRDDNSRSIVLDEEKQPNMIDGDADSIMARFNILNLRDENLKSIGMDEEKQPMIEGEFPGQKYLRPSIRGQLEDETLIVAQKQPLTGKFGSYGEVVGYESLNEYHLSVLNDTMNDSSNNSRMINGNSSGSHDSSSSDWEHVLKEDCSWKNF